MQMQEEGNIQMNNRILFSNDEQQQTQQFSQNHSQLQETQKEVNLSGNQGKMTQPIELPQLNYYIINRRQLPFDANYTQFPKLITCPSCDTQGMTKIRREIGATALLVSCIGFTLTFIFCFWQPLCGPYRMHDVIHNCSKCGEEVGIWPYKPCEWK